MRAVLFDWDGTLVDTLPWMYEATAVVMAEFGVPFDWDDYRLHFSPDWRLLYRRLKVPEEAVERIGIRWWQVYRGEEAGALLPGAGEALERLAGAGIPIGIVTGGSRASVGRQIERHGLAHLLPVRVYGDDLPFAKPHPEPLRVALRAFGLDRAAQETAFVGDAFDDVRMAAAVGARPVGITSVLGDEAELRAAGAVDVAPSVEAWVTQLLAHRV